MRRKPYLSLLLAVILLGGMLALFPKLWMALVIALLALVALQVVLVRRNLYRLPPGHTQVSVPMPRAAPPAEPRGEAPREPASPAAGPAVASDAAEPPAPEAPAASAAPAVPAASAEAPPAPPAEAGAGSGPNIDTELFSRFRQHLEQVEAEATGRAPPPPEPEPPQADDVRDRVELSGAARRAAPVRSQARRPAGAPPARPVRPESEPEADGPDLFADLRPAPLTPPAEPATPASAGPASDAKAVESKPSAAPRAAAAPPGRTQPEAPPPREAPLREAASRPAPAKAEPAAARAPATDEVSAALAGGESEDAPELADEAATLLHLAEEAAARDDWEGLRAGLDNYLAHLADAPTLVQWRARRLQVRLAIHDDDINRALQGFEDLLATGHRPDVEEVPPLLDGLLGGAEPQTAASLRVSMLVRILAVFRQSRDQRAMDRCYGWIEEAQEQVGDERRLLQYLKNHLEIRKVLGDLPGQLELIDQLGNRCYRLGLTEDAKAYYEMGLRLRAQAERARPAAAEPEQEAANPPNPGGAVREG